MYWCPYLRVVDGKSPFRRGSKDHNNVKNSKCKSIVIEVDKNKIDYPVDIPPEAKEFIEALVQKDPNLRPKTHELLKFKLFNLFPRVNNKSKK